jgi:starch synthase
LADTITDATAANLESGLATGFVFDRYEAGALEEALERACSLFRHDRLHWSQLVTTGMQQDWSWAESARQYAELYATTIARASHELCA